MREQGVAQHPTGAPQGVNYAPRGGNQNYATPGMERAQPVLGNQPPLPGATTIRYVQTDDLGQEGTLVPVNYYGDEDHVHINDQTQSQLETMEPSVVVPEGRYHMDHNTLWFIANGGVHQRGGPGPRPYKPGPTQGEPRGPCYNCQGDHWIRDCPHPRTERPPATGIPPLMRTCVDCGIKHLVQDCP